MLVRNEKLCHLHELINVVFVNLPMHLRNRGRSTLFCGTFARDPDDYNRVVLSTTDDQEDSDYVNASYIDVSHMDMLSQWEL